MIAWDYLKKCIVLLSSWPCQYPTDTSGKYHSFSRDLQSQGYNLPSVLFLNKLLNMITVLSKLPLLKISCGLLRHLYISPYNHQSQSQANSYPLCFWSLAVLINTYFHQKTFLHHHFISNIPLILCLSTYRYLSWYWLSSANLSATSDSCSHRCKELVLPMRLYLNNQTRHVEMYF